MSKRYEMLLETEAAEEKELMEKYPRAYEVSFIFYSLNFIIF